MKPPKPKSNIHSQLFSSALEKPRSWAATGETLEKPWMPCSTTQCPLGSGAPGQRNLGLAWELKSPVQREVWDRASFSGWAFNFIHTWPSACCVRIRKLWCMQYFPHYQKELHSQPVYLKGCRIWHLSNLKTSKTANNPDACFLISILNRGLSAIWAS